METEAEMIADTLKKGLLQTEELSKYIMHTSVYPREQECLKELRALTSAHPRAFMGTAPDARQFMTLLLKAINAKKAIEIGVFTGYSVLLTALSIPDDGKITAIDMDRSSYQIGMPVIDKAVKHKINFIESEALPALDQLLKDPENKEAFDFAFVDADKCNYAHYHERVMELVRPGGIVVYDNTLWGGTVAMDEGSVPESWLAIRNATLEFNKLLAGDTRVQISQLPLGDGITVFVSVTEHSRMEVSHLAHHEAF